MAMLTVYIAEDLKRKAKAKAALEGKSLSRIVSELLAAWLADYFGAEDKIKYEFNRQQILEANRQGACIVVPPPLREVNC